MKIPNDVPADGTIVLGGKDSVSVSVEGPPAPADGKSDYYIGSVAFFEQDVVASRGGHPGYPEYFKGWPPAGLARAGGGAAVDAAGNESDASPTAIVTTPPVSINSLFYGPPQRGGGAPLRTGVRFRGPRGAVRRPGRRKPASGGNLLAPSYGSSK